MDTNQYTRYPDDGAGYPHQDQHLGALQNHGHNSDTSPSQSDPLNPTSSPLDTSSFDAHAPSPERSHHVQLTDKFDSTRPIDSSLEQPKRLNKKWKQRLFWIVPLAILVIVLCILFEVYKSDFERWVRPLTDWLRKREAWSWVIPVATLFILSFPPLFGHEIVQLIVGLTYPLGVAIGIACAGSILGEAGCFIVFKYGFSWWVGKKISTEVKWAAIARIAQEAGFRGVLVIRYSIVPPHLANPLFSCTGMKFWLYMTTVILSLPKAIVFVALGAPSSEHSRGVKVAKVIAIGVLVVITIFASTWIRKKMKIATEEIKAERDIL